MEQHHQRFFAFNHRAQGHAIGLDHFEMSLLYFLLLLIISAPSTRGVLYPRVKKFASACQRLRTPVYQSASLNTAKLLGVSVMTGK